MSSIQSVISNVQALAATVVVLIAGLFIIPHLAKHRVFGIIVTIACAALVYLAIKGTLIQQVSNWFTDLGIG